MQVDKVEQTTSFRTLVFWAVQCPFFSGEEFQFGDYQILACFEGNTEATAIRIEIYDAEIPKQCLAELFATLSRIFSSDAQKGIDFRAGLLRCNTGNSEFIWKETGVLRTDGTFCIDELPHK